MRKIFALLLTVCVLTSLAACGSAPAESGSNAKTLVIAYQGGVGYAPVHIMETLHLIEENYEGEVSVTYMKLDSGAAINEGIIGGTIDVGCMGLAPAISGVSNGIPYKVLTGLCSQSHGLMSNDEAITSLRDIGPEDTIALVSTGSIQHILLGMAAEKVLGDPHALDNNIQKMSHAEGMAALESGTVKLHLTSSPFIYQERESGLYYELGELAEVWPSGNTFLVAMASSTLAGDEGLYRAVSAAFDAAIRYINENPEETARIEAEYLGLDQETVEDYLGEADCQFFPELRGAKKMADFMMRAGFIENAITMESFTYPGVIGN